MKITPNLLVLHMGNLVLKLYIHCINNEFSLNLLEEEN